jgi:hypothetical protein
MSKLEDKLSASIKPNKGKATPTAKVTKVARPPQAPKPRPPAQEMVAPEPAPARPAEAKEPERPLHPRRVWPD